MIGTVVAGRYLLEAEIGRGGMGAVWRGRDEVLGRQVALKRIGFGPGGTNPDAVRAEREARLAAKLNHANVVAVFDLVDEASDGSGQWLVMEYVEGTDLAELIRDRGRLTPDEAAPILAQTASALAAAHSVGIVHRDVKPSNILVTPDGQVKLSDFGIARTATDPSLTQTGLVTGSPAYLSPEVASGQQATESSDVWSWGATLFHALEGHPPYQVGENLLGALYRIVHEEPPRPMAAGWLTPALAGTMTRDPAQRWAIASAQEFLEQGPQALAPSTLPTRTQSYDDDTSTRILPLRPSEPPGAPPTPVAPAPTPGSGPRRPRRPWWVVVAAALAVVVAMAIAFAVGLDGGGGDGGSDDPTSATTPGPSSPSSSQETDQPTKEGMTSFIEDYISTAVRDPASAFDMLTPSFQEQSNGLDGYEGFWDTVRSAKILSIQADPDTLEVSYTYRYVVASEGPRVEDINLRLTYDDGTYLVDGES